MRNHKFMTTNFMLQVFLDVLKITPSFLLFTFPQTHSFYSNPLSLISNPPTIRHGAVTETRYGKLHVKLDNSENLKNLKKIVGLTSITLIDKKQ